MNAYTVELKKDGKIRREIYPRELEHEALESIFKALANGWTLNRFARVYVKKEAVYVYSH